MKLTEEEKYKLAVRLNEYLQKCEGSISEIKWRETQQEDYKFYAGVQDEPEVITALAAQNRPTTTYNQIKPKIDMLIGTGAQMRDIPAFAPVGEEDAPLTEIINGVVKHYRKKLKLEETEPDCFGHMVKSGRSFLHLFVNSENPFHPEISAKRIAGKDVNLDPNSVEYDLSDARYIFVDKWFEKEEVEAYWPGLDASALSQSNSSAYQPTYYSSVEDLYRVVECWYRKVEKVFGSSIP